MDRTDKVKAHVWAKQEIALEAHGRHASPCTDVEVRVDLEDPGFSRRC